MKLPGALAPVARPPGAAAPSPAKIGYPGARMGRLRHARSETEWMIPERTILGRSRACTIRLSEPEISGEHALLRWIGGWEL